MTLPPPTDPAVLAELLVVVDPAALRRRDAAAEPLARATDAALRFVIKLFGLAVRSGGWADPPSSWRTKDSCDARRGDNVVR